MSVPTLVVISGPAGSGKTQLAHKLAGALGCPAICRDEIKEGMVHAHRDQFRPAPGDSLTDRTFTVFFDILSRLVAAGVSVVAEAAFQDHVWRPNLEPLSEVASLRVVQCHADPAVASQRIAERAPTRTAHADQSLLAALEAGERYFEEFKRVAIEAPSIDVDTTSGYKPSIEEIVAFVNTR